MVLCGRENEIRRIVEHCAADRLIVLTHDAGLGATSLLEAAIAPAMEERGHITVVFRDWQGRFFSTNLKEAISSAVRERADDNFFAETEALGDLMERARERTGRKVALLFDQFEDYLRCHAGTDVSDTFDAEFSHAVANHDGKFVVALQSHAIPVFQRLSQYIPNLLGYQVVLPPLTVEAARELIRLQAGARGITVESEVADALIAAASALPNAPPVSGVHPFYLNLGLPRLVEARVRRNSTVADAASLEIFGGAERLILESLDDKSADFNPTHRDLWFRWLNVLISPEMSRLSLTEKALVDRSGKLNRFVMTLLPLVQELGLLRSVDAGDALRYEIARESMVPILRDWWTRREAFLIARRRAHFRIRSISVAVGSIVTLYVVWMLMTRH